MLLNPLKKIEYDTSPTDHSPNSQSAGKTPSVSHLCHHTEMPWRAPICTYPGEQPYSLWGTSCTPPPPHPSLSRQVSCGQAPLSPSPAASEAPGGTAPTCTYLSKRRYQRPQRHRSHLQRLEKEPQNPVSRQDYCGQTTPSPASAATEATHRRRPLLQQLEEKLGPLKHQHHLHQLDE